MNMHLNLSCNIIRVNSEGVVKFVRRHIICNIEYSRTRRPSRSISLPEGKVDHLLHYGLYIGDETIPELNVRDKPLGQVCYTEIPR